MIPAVVGQANCYNKDLSHLADEQHPHTLFIGCIDSRMIPSSLTETVEGEMLVVRNIANQLDVAAIEFSMSKNCNSIVVCGHSTCGGIEAAMGVDCLTAVDDNVRPIRKLWKTHAETIQNQHMVLEWLNVLHNLKEISKLQVVRKRLRFKQVSLCGMYFDIRDSKVTPLAVICSENDAVNFSVEDQINILLNSMEER